MSEISIKELQARLRAAADTTDEQSLIVQSCAAIEALRAERDALAAKLAEMEGQEPVVWQHRNGMLSCRRPEGRAGMYFDPLYARPVPAEMSPEFTDTARSALLWVLWHHQGGSSPVGQPIRYALGMDAHDRLSDYQVQEAKRWAELTNSETRDFHRRPAEQPVNARLLEIATGQLQHIYSENCPDPVSWPNSRDPECPACRAIIAAESEASPAYGPDNPPRLRRPDESVEAYREAMGWPTIQPQAKGD